MTTWTAVIKSKTGREMHRFDIEDNVQGYIASLDQIFTKIGPRVWVDVDGTRTVLEAKFAS